LDGTNAFCIKGNIYDHLCYRGYSGFSSDKDLIIILGDAINRGPRSLEVLRFIIKHQENIKLILGNHEIFAIALALGSIKDHRPHTIRSILEAPDRDELINFLRSCPLIIKKDIHLFLHAGVLPCISMDMAIKTSAPIGELLNSKDAKKFLERFYNKTPKTYYPDMPHDECLRLTLAYLTLIRMCNNTKTMDFSYSGDLSHAPSPLIPWFALRNDPNIFIYFGHWAALGFYQYKNYFCLDSGCVWGNKLTAIRLEDKQVFQVNNKD
jgi:bis(5'-nucleosyl)-tetraphosphatase (symmetrical)